MRLPVKMLLGLGQGGGTSDPSDAMFTGLTVAADGWQLSGTIVGAKDGGTYSGLNNKSTPGMVLTVESPSWTAAGAATTLTRYVYATAYLRQPYSNGTLRQETEDGADCDVIWSLSSRIYATDTIVGCTTLMAFFTDNGTGGSSAANPGGTNAVTNNSALADHLPQATWLTPPLERVTSSSWAPRLIVRHRQARNGAPVRAVTFSISDTSGHTVTSTVSTLTTGQYSASGYYASWYEPSWDLSSLTDGNVLTVDATIYPWVGDSFTISVDGFAEPSPNICVLKAICDVGGTYGQVFAYVDGVGGGTPAASTVAATAALTPYASVDAAVVGAVALNNSTYGRNSTSGVTVRIPAATTITELGTDGLDSRTPGALPLLIEGLDQSTSVLIIGLAASTQNDAPLQFKVKDLTLRRGGASGVGFDMKSNLISNQIVCENVTFDINGQAVYNSWFSRCGRAYFVNCSGADCGQGAIVGTTVQGTALVVGCTFCPGGAYNVVATDASKTTALGPLAGTVAAGLGINQGGIVTHNKIRQTGSGALVFSAKGVDIGAYGLAITNNVFEKYGASTAANMDLYGDNDDTAVVNVLEAGNTIVGQRSNIGYLEGTVLATTNVLKDIASKHSYHDIFNIKGDYFGTAPSQGASGLRVGNWGLRHGVDCGYRLLKASSDASVAPRYDSWLGEALGDSKNALPVGDVFGGAPNWTDDKSGAAGAGNGNYKPVAVTDLPTIPAGETIDIIDFMGTAIPTNGTAVAGALQL